MAVCLKHFLNAGCGVSSCGKCKNCPYMTPCMSDHYCETCSRELKKCHICGEDIDYDKKDLIAGLEAKKASLERDSYAEGELLVVDAQMANVDNFTSLEQALKLRRKIMEEYYESLHEAQRRKMQSNVFN